MGLPFSKFFGPDGTEYEVKDAKARNDKLDKTNGDASDTKVATFAESEDSFPSPTAGDTTKTLWGKVKKFVEDFKAWNKGVLLLGQLVNDKATNNAKLPVSAAVAYDLQQQINVQNTTHQNLSKDAARKSVSVDISKGDYLTVYSYCNSLLMVGHPHYGGPLIAIIRSIGHDNWNDSILTILHGSLDDVGLTYNFDTAGKIYLKSSKEIMWATVITG